MSYLKLFVLIGKCRYGEGNLAEALEISTVPLKIPLRLGVKRSALR